MPEGPSIVILKELVQAFKGKKILEVTGNVKTIDKQLLVNQKIVDIRSWGKHFLLCFPGFTVRIHFLLFGSYTIDEKKNANVRLGLRTSKGALYFYACSVKLLEGEVDEHYDWSGDVMSDEWDPRKARKKLKEQPDVLVCDALLDQDVFAGVGNIIKNEVLYRIRVHPMSKVGALPPRKLSEMIREARIYSFDFLKWKKAYELRKHWLAHAKQVCPRDEAPLIWVPKLGKRQRRAFYCEVCQVLYE
jgi:endonuclease-8